MATIDWTDPAAALALVQARAPFADATEAATLLELSAGTDEDDVVTYRPYVVIAHLYETRWVDYISLRGASGAQLQYRDPADARDQYLRQQARVDDSLQLTVPDAWPAGVPNALVAEW